MGGRGGRSRSYSQVRSNPPGILQRKSTGLASPLKSLNVHKNRQSPPWPVLNTAPPQPKWWNWSCSISNQPLSSSLIWVYKQLSTSPPRFSRLLHTAFISLTHSARSHACVAMDSPPETSGLGWEIPKWDFPQPCRVWGSFQRDGSPALPEPHGSRSIILSVWSS